MAKFTFNHEVRKFTLMFQLFGLAPFSQDQTRRYILSTWSLLWLIGIIFIAISALFVKKVFQQNSLSSLVGGLYYISLCITHTLILLQAYATRMKQSAIYEKLTQVDECFSTKLHMVINYYQMRRRYWIKFAVILSILGVVQVYFLVHLLRVGNQDYFWEHCFFHNIILRIRCLQNMYFVDVVSDRINLINDKLIDIVDTKKQNLNFVLHVERYRDTDFRSIQKPSFEQIFVLKQLYGKIWDITNLINECFGWSLLAITTQNFIDFTSNGYWLFLALEGLVGENVATECICSLTAVVLMLFVLAYSCYRCTGSGETTAGLVHKIEKEIENEAHNAMVREFSLQIVHEPIDISANGFFSINFDLLGSMAAAIVTYLVILIQFQLSEKKKTITANTTLSTTTAATMTT